MSLLLGFVTLLAGLTLFFAPKDSGNKQVPAIIWNAGTASAQAGDATFVNGEMKIQLVGSGGAVVDLQMGEVDAQAYPYLHIELVDPPEELAVTITWKTHDTQLHAFTLYPGMKKSPWISTQELHDWRGQVSALTLFMRGQPGETVRIRDFSLYPASPWHQLASIYSDLTGFIPWNRAAMNTYTGVSSLSPFYPIALAVPLLALSVAAYGVLLLALRKRVRFTWTVVALLFLASWVILDLVWQNRLLLQLAETERLFSGKTTAEKRAVGPDATLVKFVSQIEPLLDANNARIFVASTDQYSGMRVAYYLYPRNVFWSLQVPELPTNEYLHKGDYIAFVNPTEFVFDATFGALFAPQRTRLNAQLLYSDPAGSLLRLN